MSFKLFFASAFGLIRSTAKIEGEYEALLHDYRMFCDFEKSVELLEYNELNLLVKSDTFLQRKREMQHLVYKGSKEEAHVREFTKLTKNRRIQKFQVTQKSDELKRFELIASSEKLSNYKKVKAIVKSPTFDKHKRRDETSDEYIRLKEFHTLKESDDISFFERFEKSPEYKNYLQIKASVERRRYEELLVITGSDQFKARVAYLEDKNKWERTEDCAKEKRLDELKKMPELINYLKFKNSNAFDFLKKWNLVFEDRFESEKLDENKWITQSHWASQTLGQNFSQLGDLQSFTDGKNILFDGKSLKIEVRKEKADGMQWQMPFGFVEKEFDYTSGIVSTAASDWWHHGILEAKVKYNPASHFVDAIYLLGKENSPQINLVEMGALNRIGLFVQENGGVQANCESLSGLKSGEFYIFRLEWTAHSLVWKINGKEILTLNQHIPAHKMHLNAASIVVSEPDGNLPHQFEIAWVRFYQHNHNS